MLVKDQTQMLFQLYVILKEIRDISCDNSMKIRPEEYRPFLHLDKADAEIRCAIQELMEVKPVIKHEEPNEKES